MLKFWLLVLLALSETLALDRIIDPEDPKIDVNKNSVWYSGLQIDQDPSKPYKLKDLSINKCNLTTLDSLAPLTKLKSFTMKANKQPFNLKLKTFSKMQNLTVIDIQRSKLEKILGKECTLPSIRKLILVGNNLKKFNTKYLNCSTKLEYLNLNYNDIKFFGQKGEYDCTWQSKLKFLLLKSNKLQHFNANMLKCTKSLEHIDLSDNEITSLGVESNWDCLWPSLQIFMASNNGLPNFDMSFLSCAKKLQNLELHDNGLTTLGDSFNAGICEWPNLEQADFSGNELEFFNASSFSCSNKLKTLEIGENIIQDFGESSFMGECKWPLLRNFKMSNNTLEAFDLRILLCSNKLKVLDLSTNQISTLKMENHEPQGTCIWPLLQKISLSENSLFDLDLKMLFCSTNLQVLQLDQNNLSTLHIENWPTEDESWPALTEIDISRNSLKYFDLNLLKKSYNLTKIDLSINDLESLGVKFNGHSTCKWPKLKFFDASINVLTDFDVNILNCSFMLETLKFADNNLTSFGSNDTEGATCEWPNLKVLDLSGNEIEMFNLKRFQCSKSLNLVALDRNKLVYIEFQTENTSVKDINIQVNKWNCNFLEEMLEKLKSLNIGFKNGNGDVEQKCRKRFEGICCYNNDAKFMVNYIGHHFRHLLEEI